MLTFKSVGIFVDGQNLRLAVVSRGLSELRVLDFLSLDEVFSLPINEVKTTIQKFLDKNRAKKCAALLCLPRTDLIVRQLELPPDTGANVGKIVDYQLSSIVPSTEEEIVHGYLASSPARNGEKWMVTIFLAMKTVLQRWLELCDELGLKVVHIIPSSYALQRFCQIAVPVSKKENALLVQETLGGIEFVRLGQGRLTGSVFYGSSGTDDLVGLIGKEAEQFRAQSAMAEEVQLSVYFIGKSDPVLPPESFIGLHKLPSPSDWPMKTTASSQLFDKFRSHMAPLMAAFIGFRKISLSVDLLPAERRKKHSQWILVPTYALAALVMALLLALGLRGPIQLAQYSRNLDGEVASLEPEVRKMRSVEETMQDMERRIAVIGRFKQGDYQILAALKELSVILPSDSWIMDFSCKNNVFEIYGISSSSTSLPQLIDNSPLFKGSEFVAPVARDSNGKEVFRIRMRLEGVESIPTKSNGPAK